jgi:hypothetical protein
MVPVASDEEALELAALCPFALGASVFTRDPAAAEALARRLRAGVVTINDLVAPTADPRLPFGGRGASGHGSTRGAEGLLAMTVPKAIARRTGRRHRHLDRLGDGAEALFAAFIRFTHSGTGRLSALRALVDAGRRYRPPGRPNGRSS